jgi:hypothetical protein
MDASTPPPGFYFFVAVFWLVVVCTILMVLFKLAVWWGARYPMSSVGRRGVENDRAQNRPETPVPNRTNEPANLPNPALQSSSPLGTSAFALNPQEVAAIGRMIEHKASAEKPNKASTIWAGFGIKKGDSARYKRASEIYDTLFVVQPDFPALEATRQPRWESEQPA